MRVKHWQNNHTDNKKKKKVAGEDMELEGVGRLQAKQTPQWIVGRDEMRGGGVGKHVGQLPPTAGCCPRV